MACIRSGSSRATYGMNSSEPQSVVSQPYPGTSDNAANDAFMESNPSYNPATNTGILESSAESSLRCPSTGGCQVCRPWPSPFWLSKPASQAWQLQPTLQAVASRSQQNVPDSGRPLRRERLVAAPQNVPDSGRPLRRERLVAAPQNVPDSGRPLRRERLVAAPQNVPDSGRPLRRERLVVNTRVLRM